MSCLESPLGHIEDIETEGENSNIHVAESISVS